MKDVASYVRNLLDGFEARALELHEFSAVLPLRPESSEARERLLEKLRRLDQSQPSPLMAVPGLHQARLIVLEHAKLAGSEAAEAFPFGPLILNCVHEGDAEDMLYELFEHCAEALDGVLGHCLDYPGSRHTEACVRQLMAARVASGFFFRDRDASRTEILRALELRRRLVDFVTSQTGANDDELSHAFDRLRGGRWLSSLLKQQTAAANDTFDLRLDYGFPLLRPFEQPIEAERYWVRRAAELARARLRRATREARRQDPVSPALRGVHAKHHGLVRARFVVRSDVPPVLQHGIFVPGRSHHAWLRVSNASDRIQPDDVYDARGLAIKIENAADHGQPLDVGLPELEFGDATCQDFVLVSHPTFFAKDVRDYAVFRSIIDTRDRRELALLLAVFALRRPREAWIFARSLLRRIDHPLGIEYHSMTASALGPDLAVKYYVRPVSPPPTAAKRPRPRSPNYLRESLRRSLDPITGQPFALEFCLLVPDRDPLPVEDPRIDWRHAGARCVPVATIEVEPQDLRSDERAELAEHMVFTPWHTLQEHRPLGSLNRARLEVYRASAELRRAHNGVRRASPPASVVDWAARQARAASDSEQVAVKRRRSRRLH